MARPVTMRVDYGSDSSFLIRFQAAVKKDTRMPSTWQRKVLEHSQCLIELLLEAQRELLGKSQKAEDEERRGRRRGDVAKAS